LLLGAIELSPMQVQQIYQTIAAGGTYTPLNAIRSVMNSYGMALKRYPLQVKQVVSEESVYLLTHAMNKITKEGTAQYLKYALPAWKNAAGKTGTTNKNVDSWFAGFTGQHVVSVWVGRDDNKPTGFTGSAGALRVWGDLFKKIPTRPFKPKRPSQIKFFKVDKSSGLLYNPECGEVEILPFLIGTEPNEVYQCEPEIYYDEDSPSWEQGNTQAVTNGMSRTDQMNYNQGSEKNKVNEATIWNNNRRINQPLSQPKPRTPKVERDSGIWIDKLLER